MREVPFAVAIGLSAFLLFTLELLAGRLVLPVFGGSPAVWTTTLSFFTAVLFIGYAYAHLLVTRVSARHAGVIHVALAAAAVALTLIAPSDISTLRNPALPDAINVLLALTVVAGGPAFLLATTTPLLSAWLASRGGNPWWLYAASNGASFVALLAYPFLLEPLIPLSGQRLLFAVGITIMAALLAAIALARRGRETQVRTAESRTDRSVTTEADSTRNAATSSRIGVRRQALWLAAAFVPAGLLSATTNFLQTDLLSAPLIWVGPLAVYLASFVVAFSARGRRWLPVIDRLVPAAATLLWVPYVQPGGWPVLPLLVVELGSFFILAIAIHGHLADDLPESGHVTRFYLVLSAGGMLATAFVALVAPIVFSTVYEYPLLIATGLVVLALLPRPADRGTRSAPRGPLRELAKRLLPYVAVSVPLVLLIAIQNTGGATNVGGFLLLGSIAVLAAMTPRLLAIVTIAVLATAIVATSTSPLLRVRTFFGVIEVRSAGAARLEISGTTLHGVQFTDERRTEPTAYYIRSGPLGSIFDDLRSRTATARVGVVGLGVGTIAAYARKGDAMTFFEIDQAVVDIAENPAYYTYLADAAAPERVVVGDARLSLLSEPRGSFDLLVLDAFSSDSVPAHLLTREAIASYVRTLAPGGLLAFHLSNRYYDLAAAVAATARAEGLVAAATWYAPTPDVAEHLNSGPSIWLVAGTANAVERVIGAPAGPRWGKPGQGPVLTDDYSDLIRTLRLDGLY